MFNAFSNHELKTAVMISSSLPHSIADFYTTIDAIKENDIYVRYISKDNRFIITNYLIIYFKSSAQSLDGLWCDEMFGEVSQFDLYRLKDPSKPRYSGSLIEYIKKLEDIGNAMAFLESELEIMRAGGID
jgi:hypothetical protein